MVTRSGPLTKNADTVALGLAQIRVGASSTNIGTVTKVLTSTNSIGAMANTKFLSEREFWTLESGFPMLEDKTLPLREKAALECAFKEINPFNVGLAMGEDVVDSGASETISGEILLGTVSDPEYMRMEAVYTYPDKTSEMAIIFPRAQVISSIEMDFQGEDAVNVPVRFESKRADSGISGGDAAWDGMPLGHILFTS